MKYMNVVRKYSAVAFFLGAAGANAAAPDYSTLTAAVDFSSVTTAILAVLALVAGVIVTFKGGKMVLGAVRGA